MPDYDPESAEYYEPNETALINAATIGALMGLSAFALVSRGLFFTYAAAAAAPAVPLATVTIPFVTGGEVVASYTVVTGGVVLTESQAAIFATMQAGAFATEPVAVAAILNSWGLTFYSLDGIIALGLYNRLLNSGYFSNMGNWMGGNLHGGDPTPPGYPGFIGSYPGQGSTGGYYGCVEVDGVQECYWHY